MTRKGVRRGRDIQGGHIREQNSIAKFGTPATILSDNGSCFAGVGRKIPAKSWTPTVFEAELLDRALS